ncbi:MAG: hypothetical protein H7144_10760 [Burkholderiales bacterium]|nr:hypothetical protein [Phycisphaerae bacterium]
MVLLRYLWALPNTLLGLVPVLIVQLQGGHVRRVEGVIEVAGGVVTLLLTALPIKPLAMTLGHVVWAIDEPALVRTREHERVHVRQYERWGPLFLPAYLLASLAMKLRGRDAYRDNPFEREAYNKAG